MPKCARCSPRSADGGGAALLHPRAPAALHHDVGGIKHLERGSGRGVEDRFGPKHLLLGPQGLEPNSRGGHGGGGASGA